jgi:hypothetical protein
LSPQRLLLGAKWCRGGATPGPGAYSRHGDSQFLIRDRQAQRRPRRCPGTSAVSWIERGARSDLFRPVVCPPANFPDRFSSRARSNWPTRTIGMSRSNGTTAPSRRSVNSSRSRKPGIGSPDTRERGSRSAAVDARANAGAPKTAQTPWRVPTTQPIESIRRTPFLKFLVVSLDGANRTSQAFSDDRDVERA